MNHARSLSLSQTKVSEATIRPSKPMQSPQLSPTQKSSPAFLNPKLGSPKNDLKSPLKSKLAVDARKSVELPDLILPPSTQDLAKNFFISANNSPISVTLPTVSSPKLTGTRNNQDTKEGVATSSNIFSSINTEHNNLEMLAHPRTLASKFEDDQNQKRPSINSQINFAEIFKHKLMADGGSRPSSKSGKPSERGFVFGKVDHTPSNFLQSGENTPLTLRTPTKFAPRKESMSMFSKNHGSNQGSTIHPSDIGSVHDSSSKDGTSMKIGQSDHILEGQPTKNEHITPVINENKEVTKPSKKLLVPALGLRGGLKGTSDNTHDKLELNEVRKKMNINNSPQMKGSPSQPNLGMRKPVSSLADMGVLTNFIGVKKKHQSKPQDPLVKERLERLEKLQSENKKVFQDGEGVEFFSANPDNYFIRAIETPNALRKARHRKQLTKTKEEILHDVSPVVVGYYDEYDTRIVQPKFMGHIGSMCTSELWSGYNKKDYFLRMRENVQTKKSLVEIGGDGLYRPQKKDERKRGLNEMSVDYNKRNTFGAKIKDDEILENGFAALEAIQENIAGEKQ